LTVIWANTVPDEHLATGALMTKMPLILVFSVRKSI